jgi:peptidoglycan/xylan/chitin deacetylase (PgdA/CDA1 family)
MAVLRSAAKAMAERMLLASGVARIARHRVAGRTLVLGYHNIVPSGERRCGDLPLHLSQRSFAAQLDVLLRTHNVVPLATLFDPTEAGSRRPRVAITFDDAYRGAVTRGVEELARRGLPATIFVPPAYVGGGTFWWDVFADDDGLQGRFREHVVGELAGQEHEARRWAAHIGRPERVVPAHACCASEAELVGAVQHSGITLGAHSWSHANLTALDRDQLNVELVRPLEWIRERFRAVIPWLTYPYGVSSEAVEAAVAGAGYAGALKIEGGWLSTCELSRFALPRLDVSAGISLEGFRLRVSGLLG